jgi:predicted phosphoribosyltransferase
VARFADRRAAGRVLGAELALSGWSDPVVLGLPRGGVPVAFEVALALDSDLDVVVARKIGAPGHREFGVGAVTADGEPIYDMATLAALGLTPALMRSRAERARDEAKYQTRLYGRGAPPLPIAGRDVIVVDDGLATGVTARAALRAARVRHPATLVLAAPVGARQSVSALREEADRVVCPQQPEHFVSVSRWYRTFGQTTDEEVLRLLDAWRER